MPAISVIMPVYNGARFLGEAISGVLAQNWTDWQLIVVNDGSTDSSGDIARSFSDTRITVFDTPNGGLSVARNRGLELADAPWVSFIDADDALHPAALSTLMQLTQLAPDVDYAVASFSFTSDFLREPLHPGATRTVTPELLVEEMLFQRGAVHAACGKLYRRDILRVEQFTPGLYYEDLDFFYRYVLRCRNTAVTTAPLYFYRQHDGSITNLWNDRRLDVLRVTSTLEDYMAANYPALLPAARDRRLSANFNIFIECMRHGRRDIADDCWKLIRRYRLGSLRDRRVRPKNKAGILLSFLGRRAFTTISRWLGV